MKIIYLFLSLPLPTTQAFLWGADSDRDLRRAYYVKPSFWEIEQSRICLLSWNSCKINDSLENDDSLENGATLGSTYIYTP